MHAVEAHVQDIIFSEEIIAWGKRMRDEEARLVALSGSTDFQGNLDNLWAKLEGRTVKDHDTGEDRLITDLFRVDQMIGVDFWRECPNPLIADEPGLGKTWEVIGGILQNDEESKFNLVICPKLSIESVWLEELNAFQDEVVFVAPEGRKQRDKLLKEVAMCREEGIPFWLVVNPAMISLRRVKQQGDTTIYDHMSGEWLDVQFPFLFDIDWQNIIVDEAHLSGLGNPSSQFSRAIRMMKCEKRTEMTGTPAGGKPLRLWGMLNWLEPGDFGAKHTWAKRWLKHFEIEAANGKEITEYRDLKDSMEEEFYKEHRRYILRRRKVDVFKDRQKPHHVSIWVKMTDRQRQQYELMEDESVMNIFTSSQQLGRVSMPNVLAQNTWLKQFAFSYCDVEERSRKWDDFLDAWVIKYKAIPTPESPKLEALWAKIQEIGADDPGSGEQVVVFSQFREMADLTTEWLRAKHVLEGKEPLKVAKITGDVGKRAVRQEIIRDFQEGGKYSVIVMTSKTGGVSINLDRANNVIFLDEDWDPDVQTQAANRVDRASRDHVVTVTTIRTEDTIESYIQKRVAKKEKINDILLDRYRQMVKERGEL
jgi:SNF2 family DNA or RNA helicase